MGYSCGTQLKQHKNIIRGLFFSLEPNNDSALNADAAKYWNKEGLFCFVFFCHRTTLN